MHGDIEFFGNFLIGHSSHHTTYDFFFPLTQRVLVAFFHIRSLIASMEENSKDLLDLCIDVIYHNNMKAFGLHQLILLYIKWEREKEEKEEQEETEENHN